MREFGAVVCLPVEIRETSFVSCQPTVSFDKDIADRERERERRQRERERDRESIVHTI